MAGDTNIEWATKVWNPVVGCSVVSPGCTNCYAMKMAARIESMAAGRGQTSSYDGLTVKTKAGAVWTGEMRMVAAAMPLPLRWRKPERIFVNSMSDLFHESVPDAWIDHVFAVMALASQHTFMILTKRPERMRRYLTDPDRIVRMLEVEVDHPAGRRPLSDLIDFVVWAKPLPNVWLGASVEDQFRAEERREPMARIAGAGWATFVSYEPALSHVSWEGWEFLRWLICGGESGPKARWMHPVCAREARDFCARSGIAFFFKQWGTYAWAEGVEGGSSTLTPYRVGKKAAGRLLDGGEHNAMPGARP